MLKTEHYCFPLHPCRPRQLDSALCHDGSHHINALVHTGICMTIAAIPAVDGHMLYEYYIGILQVENSSFFSFWFQQVCSFYLYIYKNLLSKLSATVL